MFVMIKNSKCTIQKLLLLTLILQSCIIHASEHDSKKQKTIFMTGAAGFIGSNFLKYMFDKYQHYNFLVLDALTYAGSLDNIPGYIHESPRFKFFYGSVTNSRLVDLLMKQSDFVVHFAAESHVTRSISDSAIFFETDVIGTRVLLESLVLHKNVERFIHISTCEVCGTAEMVPMDEEHPIKPKSPYAAAKAGADRMVYAYQCTYDIPTVIIRPFNNYGPNQHSEKVIPRFITSALQNNPLTIHGDGLQTRDWMHVEDTCRALDMVLHHKNFDAIKHEVIHIGSGKDISILEIAQLVKEIFDLPESAIVFTPDRPGQISRHIASIKKAKRLLEWEPKISFEDGLRSVASWYSSHSTWWNKRESMKTISITIDNDTIVL